MIPGLSIFMMFFGLLFSIAFPVVLLIVIKKKYKTGIAPFFVGCAVWIGFAMILEQIMHSVILNSSVGTTITGNIYLYALYGGLAAGLFEETGRFVAMKFWLKKYYANPYNSIMYGAGHGGIEVLLLLGVTNINNIIYSVLYNSGLSNVLLDPLPDDAKMIVMDSFMALRETSPLAYLAGDFERIVAVMLHISLSVLVWISVVYGKKALFPLAIFLHFFMDAMSVLVNSWTGSVVIVEVVIAVISLGCACFAYYLWKGNITPILLDESTQNE